MDNRKDNDYYVNKIINDLNFIIIHTDGISLDEFEKNEILIDSTMFRLIQISENSNKLTDDFKTKYNSIKWRALKGLRNRIVHEYGNIDLTIIFDTVKNDIPIFLDQLNKTFEEIKN